MTKQKILQQIEEFQYFDQELNPLEEKINEIRDEPDEKVKEILFSVFMDERKIVHKLLTVENNSLWKEGSKSDFYKSYYKKKVTNDNQYIHDYTGIIPGWGMYMSEDEFKLYEEIYNELFELV